ncbi:MAG: hypothetical protein ACR2RV_01650 [Verrucomicrobiales bacterium]
MSERVDFDDPKKMKIHFIPVVLAFILLAGQAAAAESRFGATQRFIFQSILEGLYEDGVSTEDVEQILMRREREEYFHFIYACPVCTASVWAFEAYRDRPEKLYCVKSGASTFGFGLGKEIRDGLHSENVGQRLSTINTLIGRWIDRRMDTLRLTEEERAELAERLEEKREEGMARLNQFRNVPIYAPAYQGKGDWECAVCLAVVGKPMPFGENSPPEPESGDAEQGGTDRPDPAADSEGSEKP